jgi:hypothetical protein
MAGLLEQAVCAEARCFQCELSYILYTSILVWIMTTFCELSDLPCSTASGVELKSAWSYTSALTACLHVAHLRRESNGKIIGK